MIKKIVSWIKDYAETNNFQKLIVGISGGIDSAVVSTLCSLSGIDTIVVSIPINQKDDQLQRCRKHANWLTSNFKNVKFIEKDFTKHFIDFESYFTIEEKTKLSIANSKSRMRMMILYQISGSMNGIVVGTGNKVEDFGVGFFTKYGDGGVDISPIADLTKTEVRNSAKELNIIEEIQKAAPTDGLWEEDRTDEEQLGATYEELEWAMDFKGDTSNLSKREKEVLNIYRTFNTKNLHKMSPIPIFKKNKN
jgi:NAD+ synthase